jgi:hypothetical protein
MSDVDLPVDAHLADLAEHAGAGLDKVFGHCVGYPVAAADRAARIAWLRTHLVPSDAVYVHTVGRGVAQIRDEARLRAAIEDFLDRPGVIPAGASAVEVHGAVRSFVRGRPDLRWALRPPPGPGLGFRLRETVHAVAVPALGLAFLPVLLPVAGGVVGRLLWLERHDVPDQDVPTTAHLRDLEQREDFGPQNPFFAVGPVKAGPTRRLALRASLFALDYGLRHLFIRDQLAGVRTIHFARWIPLDGARQAIFASNYDGTVESYMDDFIDRLAIGLNFVFNHGLGYPATRFLLWGGARRELAFKRYLRRHQLPVQVWYSAYDQLTARNVDDNSRLRRGLTHPLTESAAADWLKLL